MKLEHIALNISSPIEWSQWYVEHVGLEVARQMHEAPFTTFLRDDSGLMMIEVYNNPPEQVPDYKNLDPLIFHIAFVSADVDGDRDRLLAAGATLESDDHLDGGTHLVMLRDPWGVCLQLCKRGAPMLKA